jgi:hypothetical protein
MRALFAANVGPVDRGIRIGLGLALLGLMVMGPETWWGLLGVLPLLTGIFGTCPLYSLLGLSTGPAG